MLPALVAAETATSAHRPSRASRPTWPAADPAHLRDRVRRPPRRRRQHRAGPARGPERSSTGTPRRATASCCSPTSDGRYWATTRGAGDADFARGPRALSRRAGWRATGWPLQMSPVEAMRIADARRRTTSPTRVRRRRAVLSGLCVWTGASASAWAHRVAERAGRSGAGRLPRPAGRPERRRDVRAGRGGSLRQTLRVAARDRAAARRRSGSARRSSSCRRGSCSTRRSTASARSGRSARASNVVALLPRRPRPRRGAGVPLRRRPERDSSRPRTSARPLATVAARGRRARRRSPRRRAGRVLQTNDLVAGPRAGGRRVAGDVPARLRADEREARRALPQAEGRGAAAGARRCARGPATSPRRETRKKPAPEPTSSRPRPRNPFDADGIPAAARGLRDGPGPAPEPGAEDRRRGAGRGRGAPRRARDAGEGRAGRGGAEADASFASSRARETHESEWTLEVAPDAAGREAADPAKTWHPFLTRIAMEPGITGRGSSSRAAGASAR